MNIAKNRAASRKFLEAVEIKNESVRQLASADIEPKIKQKIINYTNSCTYGYDILSKLLQDSKTDKFSAHLRRLCRTADDNYESAKLYEESNPGTARELYLEAAGHYVELLKLMKIPELYSRVKEILDKVEKLRDNPNRSPTKSVSKETVNSNPPSSTSATTCSYSDEDLLVLKASSKINNKVGRLLLELLNV